MTTPDDDSILVPPPEPALERVAQRVHALRVRRRAAIGSTLGALVLVVALATAAFASNGKPHAARVNVSDDATTTSVTPTTGANTSISTATSTSLDTTTTIDTSTSTPPGSGSNGPTPPAGSGSTDPTTTTPPTPADLHFTLDRDRLVIQSGTTATFSYTVTNTGDLPGNAEGNLCRGDELWPIDTPNGWPSTANPIVICQALSTVRIPGHSSQTLSLTVIAGRRDAGAIVPAPPGQLSYPVDTLAQPPVMLPVTITAPAELPFTTTFPSHVTVASGAAHTETFTLTNRLAAPVTFHLVGPCMFAPAAPCTAHPGAPLDEYWSSDVSIGADATVTMTLELSGTSDLEGPGLGNTPLAPGTYHFEGPGGMPLTLTVTP